MGNFFSSELNTDITKINNLEKVNCSSCEWRPLTFCEQSDGSKTYDASCHDYQVNNPHSPLTKITTHGYDCIASESEFNKSGLYNCNTDICQPETLKCNTNSIPSKPSGGDTWNAGDYTNHNIELNCKEFLEKHSKSGNAVNVNFMKNKCSEIFTSKVMRADRDEFKKYCDSYFAQFPSNTKYSDINDCYSDEQKRSEVILNNTWCQNYLERYPRNNLYKDVDDCVLKTSQPNKESFAEFYQNH